MYLTVDREAGGLAVDGVVQTQVSAISTSWHFGQLKSDHSVQVSHGEVALVPLKVTSCSSTTLGI